MSNIDPTVLRKAVRLVHCLQKERGASCAYSVSPNLFERQMSEARHQTDTSVRIWSQLNVEHIPISNVLHKLRASVDRDFDEEKLEDGKDLSMGEYHRFLVSFNSLISSIVHSFLIAQDKRSGTIAIPKTQQKSKYPMRRIKSSEAALSSRILEMAPSRTGSSADFIHKTGVSFQPVSNTPRLMNLLECFVRLKESTGLERALLSIMFAMGKVDHRLLNDLVLEVENQHQLILDLKALRDLDGNLVHLIRENVGLPPSMERLQAFILREFDLSGFPQEMKSEELWNLITVYMDKLHSLELLIVEELECSLNDDGLEQGPSNHGPEPKDVLNSVFGVCLPSDVARMTAEEVKAKLLAFATSSSSVTRFPVIQESTPSPPISVGVQLADDDRVPSEWDIDLYEIHFQKRIGRGTAGTTYLAKWSGREVAVKVAAITEMGMDGWAIETQSLRKLHHPNIIRLLGSVYNESPLTYCLVLEYCNGGDLHEALKKPTHSKFFSKIATDIAHGMNYLHARGIIHRDIKPANVLLDGDVSTGHVTAKVTDFGVAAIEAKTEMTSETGTYRWMAPEVIRHHPYSEKADCYSFGVVLWQLITREDPFQLSSPLEAAGMVALEGARPPLPSDTPPAIKILIENCWVDDPEWRYPFGEIVEKLDKGFDLSSEEERWIAAPFGHPVYTMEEEVVKEEAKHTELTLPSTLTKHLESNRVKGLRKLFAGGRRNLQKKTSL